MFEQLASLPLFQGVSAERIMRLVEKLPFHFVKCDDGDAIISPGTRCEHLRFVVSGAVRVAWRIGGKQVVVRYDVQAPGVIGPEYLFGRDNCYPYEVTASGAAGLLLLSKRDYLVMLHSDRIFLFNILNLLSTAAQRSVAGFAKPATIGKAERFMEFVGSLVPQGATNIALDYQQRDLCSLLGITRPSLLLTLEELAANQLLTYDQHTIQLT